MAKKITKKSTVALLFVFSNYYLTMVQVCLKDLSPKLQTNYTISYFLPTFNA
jgi:hypothetical protein